MLIQLNRAVCLLFAATAFLWSSVSAQSTIAECSLFADGPNATWTHVLTLTTASDAGSADAQSFSINITSLPAEGANYRVFKTTANGSSFFGNPQPLSLGENGTTVAAVTFDRAVKIQFSSGDIGFDALTINGEAQNDCFPVPDAGTAISACSELFSAGANANWPHVLTLTTASDAGSSAAQSFSMNVTSLPAAGANYRVYKTTANGSDFFGNPQALSVGPNSATIAAVSFDRTVKIQFSSGDVQFDALSINGEAQSCDPPAPTAHPVTFSVNTDNITVGPNGMYVGGGFLGGSDAYALTDNGDNNWSITLDLEEGTSGHWVFFNSPTHGGDWGTKENLDGQPCGDPANFNDRFLEPVTAPVTLEYCFAECTAECPAPPTTYDVTFRVDLSQYEGDFGTAYVNGTFNGWCGACNPMTDNGDGTWQTTLPLEAGEIQYKFTLDAWTDQESLPGGASCTFQDGSFVNRITTISEDTDLGLVCWNSCEECVEGGPTTHPVTFSVNTDNITVGANGMYIGGGFLGGANAYALTDNGDNNWSITLDLVEGTTGNWVFLNSPSGDGDWGAKENLDGEPCADVANWNDRLLAPVTGPTTEEYCFGECTAECPAPATTANVTFRVDMNNFDGDFNVVNINGSFNGWCGGCNPLSDDNADGVYEVTLPLEIGTIEYKFTLDGWTQQEEFQPGGSCTSTIDGFTNRTLTFDADTDLAAVCYNSCDACQSAPGCTDSGAVNYDSAAQNDDGSCLYAVTFQVDLSVRGLADGDIVYTNGTYNGWCGGCNPMTDAGDGLWTGTFNLPAGDQEYKFTINAWSDQEYFDGSESCTTDPAEFVNRVANISAATTLPVVCWNSCEACPLVAGCMDSGACNYNADAEVDDASCTYPAHPNFDCDGNCNNDADGDGICDELEGLIPEAESHCGIGTMWDAELGQCVFNVECAGDINLDGAVTSGDILLMLANFGTWCPGYGPDAGE